MYPRLFLAKNLLKDDGVIFVHIDDNEVHNLRLLMNEIFGEENFISELVWKKRVSPANDSHWFSSDHEYILIFAKFKEKWSPNKLDRNEKQNSYYTNPDNDTRGPWNSAAYTCNKNKDERPNLYYPLINPNTGEEVWPKETAVWAYSKETHEQHLRDNLLYWGVDGKSKSPRKKQFITEAKKVVPRSVLDYTDVGSTQSATLDFLKIFEHNYFNYTKPIELIKRLVKLSIESNDIIIDFFAGSGTTGQAVLELNKEDSGKRKFILVQLPEQSSLDSEAYRAGFKTIAEITKERIRRVIKKIEKEKTKKPDMFDDGKQDLGFKVFKLTPSNFKIWRSSEINEENLVQQLETFTNPVHEDSPEKNMLYELILKAGYQLTDKIEDNNNFYSIANNQLIIALKKLDEKIITEIIKAKPKKVITLDNLFTGNDQLKTNTVLQMKDAEIDFKTI
jgi:adenine-specific DNA-methyltransferase